jgi:hypothetical protein
MSCGREVGGDNVSEQGPCPAYPNYGTTCAKIVGTLCNGGDKPMGTYAQKLGNCMICPYYKSKYYEP